MWESPTVASQEPLLHNSQLYNVALSWFQKALYNSSCFCCISSRVSLHDPLNKSSLYTSQEYFSLCTSRTLRQPQNYVSKCRLQSCVEMMFPDLPDPKSDPKRVWRWQISRMNPTRESPKCWSDTCGFAVFNREKEHFIDLSGFLLNQISMDLLWLYTTYTFKPKL